MSVVRGAILLGSTLAALLGAGVAIRSAERSAPEPEYRLTRLAVDPDGGGDATISPDGGRFVTTSKRAGHWDLWIFERQSREWTQVTDHPADDFEARWSPDGERLAFTSSRGGHKNVWTLALDTGELRQLTFSKYDDEYPAWSPDGRSIAYTGGPWGRRDYFVVPAEGGEPRRISRESGRAGACSFDPDGASLVCHRYDQGTGDLLRVWLDGEVSPLSIGRAWDYKPSASPDGEWLAFSRSLEGPSRIVVMPAGGGRPRALTASPYADRWPTWTGSGHNLLFHRFADRGVEIKLLVRRTGATRTVVGPEEAPLQASLHPSGEELVYCALAAERRVLRRVHLAGGETAELRTGPGEACFPTWSRDGSRIAFASKSGSRWEVSVIAADGSGRRDLTAGVAGLRGMDGPLDWSPDDRKILFHADTEAHEASLYTVDVASGAVERITDGGWFDESPSWTPDGEGVVFMSTRGGDWTWSILRMSLADSSMETLAGPDWVEKNFPRMTRDGAAVWSVRDDSGVRRIAERSADGEVRLRSPAGEDAVWPSLAGDEDLVAYTVVTHEVEYWLAENVFSAGSPLARPGAEPLQVAGSVEPFSPPRDPSAGPVTSPVDLGRR